MQIHTRLFLPLCYSYMTFLCGFSFFPPFFCLNYEQALSESRRRVRFTAPISTVALAMFQWCGYRRALQPRYFPNGLCWQEGHNQRWQKWAVFKSSIEIWQLQLFILDFHNFLTWHLSEGEYYWIYIIFLNACQSMKKYISPENVLFLRNMDPSI